jgi:RTA1 like protein
VHSFIANEPWFQDLFPVTFCAWTALFLLPSAEYDSRVMSSDSNSDNDEYEFKLYRYVPSLPVAVTVAAIFGILTLAHLYRMYRWRSWFCIPFIIGGIFETVGYIGRILSHFDNEKVSYFIIQSLPILLGPALFAASIYMTLGRIIQAVQAAHLSIIPIRWQTRLFVCGDVISFLTQMTGGGVQATGSLSSMKTGENIILAGLWLQIVFFGFFVVCSTIFHIRCIRKPTTASVSSDVPWQRMLVMLYTVSGLILVRSLFRVIEYIQGNAGYLLRTEWPIYVFDALLMAITMGIFLVWHPGFLREKLKPVGQAGFGELESLDRDKATPQA